MAHAVDRFIRAPHQESYDLIVIGSGPGGQRAAVQAAKLGKTVLVVERNRLGGSCLNLGTIPSKALREAALSSAPGSVGIGPVMARTRRVIQEEAVVIEDALTRNKIDVVSGKASFVDSASLEIVNDAGTYRVRAEKIVIASGARPKRPPDLNFDGLVLFDSDTILDLNRQPNRLLVLGAGVVGCEYASIFARMGVKVTLVEGRDDILPTLDKEIVAALLAQLKKAGVEVRTGTQFVSIKKNAAQQAAVEFTSVAGRSTETFEAVLYCLGRTGNIEDLNLSAIGVQANNRGVIEVNGNYQTKVPTIYAVGDITGSPGLAASSSEQGRLAALHAFTGASAEFPDTFPYGVYTIPEISSVGFTQAQMLEKKVEFVVGKAEYAELARGKMLQDEYGFLKLVVHAKTRRIVGIHIIGISATELVHIGQVAIYFGAKVEFFVENVFNYPTLAEAYKVAAHNAINQLPPFRG